MYKRLDRNDQCWCGSGKKYKSCHAAFDDKIINFERQGMIVPNRGLFKTEKDIEGIKKSDRTFRKLWFAKFKKEEAKHA